MGIWYATREDVKASLEIAHTAYANRMIDSKLEAASRAVESGLHRRFYPERRTIRRDWPNHDYAPTWQLWLGSENEIISVEEVVSGDTVITDNIVLRRGDDIDEPPYSSMEIDLTSSAAFGGGNSFQRSIIILALFGDKDTQTNVPAGVLPSAITNDVTVVINPVNGYFPIGVGSLLRIGSERGIVVERRMSDTNQNTTGSLEASQANTLIPVADGSSFAYGEDILIDAERMHINDIAGNNLIVDRAWDGTTLAEHETGADIYAKRTFLIQRAVLGSTMGSHAQSTPVYAHQYPGLVNELCIAIAVSLLEQSAAGYARTVGSGSSTREVSGKGVEDVWARAYQAHGVKSRKAAI